ncbi:acyl carrier protein [Ligilactobacillus salivarius]|nr:MULTISPECIES: acyl carrier protein [Lactobacillaceae]MBM6708769.1 acyl carrier protein [Ligilactobacillus salivarius]
MNHTLDFLKNKLLDLGIEEEEIQENSTLAELMLDSTEKVDITLAIKEEFGVTVSLDDDNLTLLKLAKIIDGGQKNE